jgi:hypothetical protein
VTWKGGAALGLVAGAGHGLQGPEGPVGGPGPGGRGYAAMVPEGSDVQVPGSSPSQCEISPGGLVTPPGTTDLGR